MKISLPTLFWHKSCRPVIYAWLCPLTPAMPLCTALGDFPPPPPPASIGCIPSSKASMDLCIPRVHRRVLLAAASVEGPRPAEALSNVERRDSFSASSPSLSIKKVKVVPHGLGPRTLQLLAVRYNQLSYET